MRIYRSTPPVFLVTFAQRGSHRAHRYGGQVRIRRAPRAPCLVLGSGRRHLRAEALKVAPHPHALRVQRVQLDPRHPRGLALLGFVHEHADVGAELHVGREQPPAVGRAVEALRARTFEGRAERETRVGHGPRSALGNCATPKLTARVQTGRPP